MKKRLLNLLISTDQFLLSLITLGWSYPDETISAFLYRMENSGTALINKAAGICRKGVDFLFSAVDPQHCFKSFKAESNRKHLHKDYFREVSPK